MNSPAFGLPHCFLDLQPDFLNLVAKGQTAGELGLLLLPLWVELADVFSDHLHYPPSCI